MAKTTLKMSKVGGILLLNFKIYFQATVIKKLCCWCRDRMGDQGTEYEVWHRA